MKRVAGLVPVQEATSRGIDGERGAKAGDTLVHLVRTRGLVVHQEVVLGGCNVVLHPRLTQGLDKFM